ncbi:hypothetical protein MPSEU_000823800 [Mayamaea pseudoterrestris]|nr:hypothetical protein MPSEU_000823800 [Mayamaea pseudoterrestris]
MNSNSMDPSDSSDAADSIVLETSNSMNDDEGRNISILCLLNNKAVNFMEKGEYDSAEALLMEALQVSGLEDDKKRETDSTSPITVLQLNLDAQPTNTSGEDDETSLEILQLINAVSHEACPSCYCPSLITECSRCRPSFDDGLDPFPEAIRLDENSSKVIANATILYNIGRLFHNQKQYASALQRYDEAAEEQGSVADSNNRVRLQLVIRCSRAAVAHIQNNTKYAASWRIYSCNNFLNFCRECQLIQAVQLAKCLNAFAVLLYQTGSFDKGLAAVNESISIIGAAEGNAEDDNLVATCYFNLGRILARMGRHDEALLAFEHALPIRRRNKKEHVTANVAVTLFWLGQSHGKLGNTEQSLDAYRECQQMIVGQLGNEHPDYFTVLKAIMSVYHDMARYDDALRVGELAVSIGCKIFGPEHAEMATIYMKLGDLRCDDVGAAMKWYKAFFAILEKYPQLENNEHTIAILQKMGTVYHQEKNYVAALKVYQRALRVQRQLECAHLQIASTLFEIGQLFYSQNQFDEALNALQEGICIQREILGDDHELIARNLLTISQCLHYMGKLTLALDAIYEAYRIHMLASEGETSVYTFHYLYFIGWMLYMQGDSESALVWYSCAERFSDEMINVYDVNSTRITGWIHHGIAVIFVHRGDFERALPYFCKGFTANNDRIRAVSYFEMGNIKLMRGNLEDALKCYSAADRLYQRLGESSMLIPIEGATLWRFELVCPPAACVA